MRPLIFPLILLSDLLARLASRIIAARGWRRWLTAFAAGLAAALSMAPVYALPLLAVGVCVLVLLIDASGDACGSHGRPRRSAFVAGWFFGFGYFLAGVYWMAFSFFVQADEFAWMAPFAVMGMPAFLALFTGAAGAICASMPRRGWARIFLFAGVFALVEYARGHVLTGLPWNLTGQALAGLAVGAQTAAWYGAYGLSLVTVFLCAAPVAALGPAGVQAGAQPGQNPRRLLSGLGVMLLGALILFGIGALRLAAPAPAGEGRVLLRIVQPNIPQREKINWDYWRRNFDRQLDLSRGAVPPDAQLFILWPENGAPLLNEAPEALSALARDLPEKSVLLAGAVRRESGDAGVERFYNSIAMVEQSGAARVVTGNYDKHHLVPFGEYLPFYDALNAMGLAQLTPYGDAGFAAGSGPLVMRAGGSAFAPMICYEAIFPGRSYPRGERPEWLAMVTNDAWFGDTSGPRQHLDMARLRAVEAGLPLARAANTGVSALFDGKGRLLARVSLYRSGRIDAPLPPPLSRTLYDRLGDWLFLVMAASALVIPALRGRR